MTGHLLWGALDGSLWRQRVTALFSAGMDQPFVWSVLGTMLLIIGLWALQPGARRGGRIWGILACFAGLACCVRLLVPLTGPLPVVLTFRLTAALTLMAAVTTVVTKNPVYSAIWFALTLIGTSILMLLLGGQFVAVATVAVYAGAIVVTFLFVLMLAQSSGRAPYDRLTWGRIPAWWGAPAAALLFVMLCSGMYQESAARRQVDLRPDGTHDPAMYTSSGGTISAPGTVAERFPPHHVAKLGGTLFTRYLIPVQVVATLLLAALVGAVAIASYGPTVGGREQPL